MPESGMVVDPAVVMKANLLPILNEAACSKRLPNPILLQSS